jgi:hypothetical protein
MPPHKVAVTTQDLYDFAKILDELAGYFPQVEGDLKIINVHPGHPQYFPEAESLKKAFETRVQELGAAATKLRLAFTSLAQKLREIAGKYTKTEQLNKVDAEKLGNLMQTIEEYLPGVTITVPQKPPET